MPLLSTATGCATIVSLIGMFRSERRAADAQSKETYEEFIEWLRRHEHTQVIDVLEENIELGKTIQHVIAANHDEVLEQLETINSAVTDIAANLTGFASLVAACNIVSGLSGQSISILKQMNVCNARRFLEGKLLSGTDWLFLDGVRGTLNIQEPRFIEDDLKRLCDCKLLILNCNDKGERIFNITRSGAALGDQSPT